MDEKSNDPIAGAQGLNALLVWWGIPMANGNAMIDRQWKRFHHFAADLQGACGDAYGGQMDILSDSNNRLARSYQDLLGSRRLQEVMAVELDILATFLEGASRYAKGGAELTEKLQACCCAIAQYAAEDLRQQVPETAPAAERAWGVGPVRRQEDTPTIGAR